MYEGSEYCLILFLFELVFWRFMIVDGSRFKMVKKKIKYNLLVLVNG